MKAALYCRVSTEEQRKSGYSLRQQLETLRRYCEAHDLEVVGEFEDRASGASLDRLGLDALRDAVSAGGVDVVLAQDRDRFSREPAHHYVLGEEFLQHGTSLKALNDYGDDSPEGVLTDGILDQLAKFERAKTAERTRRGRMRKAQEGKVVGTGKAPYGFYYADDHYHVDPDRMPFVHEIFEMIADGHSIYKVAQHLRRNGTPSPRGADGSWGRTTIRNIILSDIYLGTFWWGKEKRTTTMVSVVEDGVRTYKKKVKREERPKEEWTAIPVPDSGIPPETIARARDRIDKNTWTPSRNSNRTWELCGGIAVCGHCGSRLQTHSTSNAAKTKYFYYVCPKRTSRRDNGTCPNTKHYRAENLELLVKDTLVDAFRPETWEAFVDDVCDRKLEDLHRLVRSNPGKTRESLAGRIKTLETKMSRARELFIDGDLPRTTYEEKKSLIRDEIGVVQEELSKVDNLDEEVHRVEDLRHTLKGIENPLSGHYALTEFPESYSLVDINEMHSLGYGSRETASRRRQEFYRQSGLRVKVGEELEISLGIDRVFVSADESASDSTRSPTGTL
jgi:site-specific DNA recombinase